MAYPNLTLKGKKPQAKLALKTGPGAIKILRVIRNTIKETTALSKISNEENSTPFKVLISTILSSRTRDPVTEAASARLYSRFPNSRSLSHASEKIVAKLIIPVSFYRVKAGRIIQVSKIIEEKYHGSVPSNLNELLELPGVGRKTANCVLVYGFRTAAIPVDVHVHRVSNRIGLVDTETPAETEADLTKIYKEKYWSDVNELFVRFGQTICKPLRPHCETCRVQSMCNYYESLPAKKSSLK